MKEKERDERSDTDLVARMLSKNSQIGGLELQPPLYAHLVHQENIRMHAVEFQGLIIKATYSHTLQMLACRPPSCVIYAKQRR